MTVRDVIEQALEAVLDVDDFLETNHPKVHTRIRERMMDAWATLEGLVDPYGLNRQKVRHIAPKPSPRLMAENEES